MATSTRHFALAARRAAASPRTLSAASRRAFHQSSRRFTPQPSGPQPLRSSVATSSAGLWLGAGLAAAGAGWWFGTRGRGTAAPAVLQFQRAKEHYQAVYDEVARLLQEHDEYEDGSYGPVVLRLAWHCSGTYDKETGTGGSNGATMRFKPEGDHGANRGLLNARDFLEPVKRKYPWISYSDLWILAGVCATQEMLGPKIPYRPGRADKDIAACTPDGRLPNGALGQDHIRAIFYRMGFDDREIVALSGAHAVGRCHTDHSGFDGPWTFSPTVITNEYYKLLDGVKWEYKKWDGPKQFVDSDTKSLMMLPTDMALVKDDKFRAWVKKYATDSDLWFDDFSAVLVKLFELGVPFREGSEKERWVFKTLDESEADAAAQS